MCNYWTHIKTENTLKNYFQKLILLEKIILFLVTATPMVDKTENVVEIEKITPKTLFQSQKTIKKSVL